MTHHVRFECGHVALLLDDEHGDGSAWCQQCGEFQCYEDSSMDAHDREFGPDDSGAKGGMC